MTLISQNDDLIQPRQQYQREADSRRAAQYDEVAAARERRDLRERQARMNLAEWNDGVVIDSRQEYFSPQKTTRYTAPMPLGDKIMAALIGLALLIAAAAFGFILGGQK